MTAGTPSHAPQPPIPLQASSPGPIPSVYINSFDANISPTELTIVAKQNNIAVIEIKLAFATARSLGEALAKGVEFYDKVTGMVTPTTDELLEKLKAAGGKT